MPVYLRTGLLSIAADVTPELARAAHNDQLAKELAMIGYSPMMA